MVMEKQLLDVAIIGGGPAGLNAALVLGRARKHVVVIDEGRPRNAVTRETHGFLTRDGISPGEFRRMAEEEISAYSSVSFMADTAVSIAGSDLPRAIGCQITEAGMVNVDDFGKTNVPGVYSAGDAASRLHQAIAAASMGAFVAAAMNNELNIEAWRRIG